MSECPVKTISQDDLFDLELIKKDKLSDLLFLIGTFIGMYVNSKAEQKIVCPEEAQASSQSEAAQETTPSELIVVVILLFLSGTIILANTAYTRLNKQITDLNKEPDMTFINYIAGSKLNILGLLIRIVGYVFSFVGNQIKAENPV